MLTLCNELEPPEPIDNQVWTKVSLETMPPQCHRGVAGEVLGLAIAAPQSVTLLRVIGVTRYRFCLTFLWLTVWTQTFSQVFVTIWIRFGVIFFFVDFAFFALFLQVFCIFCCVLLCPGGNFKIVCLYGLVSGYVFNDFCTVCVFLNISCV